MKVTLRQKALSGGNISLYLDIYDKGKRHYEYLNLYLIPEIDDESKALNAETLERAQQMKADKILHPSSNTPSCSITNKPTPNIVKQYTVLEWIEHYISLAEKDEDKADSTVEQSQYLHCLMKEFLKTKHKQDLALEKFNKDWFVEFFCWLKEEYVPKKYKRIEAKPLCKGTLRNIQQRIVAVFNRAVREGALSANPYKQLDKDDVFSKPKISRKEILSPNELKLYMASKETSPGVLESQRAFVFACFTGLRVSDIRNLKWSDIKVNPNSNTMVFEQQKTKTINSVPICKTAILWMPERGDDDYVFHLPSASCVYDNVRRIAKKVGIAKEISFHTSRHTFGTLTLAVTGDLYTTMKLLGHKNLSTTEIYAEVLMEDKIKAVNNANGVFSKARHTENKTIPQTKRTAATNTHPRKIIDIQANV